jgi:hypothetical protein
MADDERARTEAELAAAEAAKIGGDPGPVPVGDDDEPLDEAQRPLEEAGEGESEGAELADADLIEHATHGDQHAARRVLDDDAAELENPETQRP